MGLEGGQQGIDPAGGDERAPVRVRHETLLRHPVEEGDEIVVIAIDIQQADGMGVLPELGPGPHLEQFLHRADATRHGDEAFRQLHHQGLAGMHGLDDVQVGQTGMGDFLEGQEFRNDPGNTPARSQGRISQFAHESHTATAVDDFDAPFGERPSDSPGSPDKDRIQTRIRSTIDAYGFHQ